MAMLTRSDIRPWSSRDRLSRNTGWVIRLRSTLSAGCLVALTAVLLGALAQPAHATPAQVAPDLVDVRVDSLDYRAAQSRYDAAAASLASAREILTNATAELNRLQAEDTRLTAQLAEATQQKKQATVDFAEARASLRAIAVSRYVNGSTADQTAVEDLDAATRTLSERGLSEAVSSGQVEKATTARATLDRLARTMSDLLAQRTTVRQRTIEVQEAQRQAAADEARYAAAVDTAQTNLDRARVTAVVIGSDFQLVAFDAYRRAAQAAVVADPGCGVPWWALAGITRIESKHGSFGGSTLLFNGDTSRLIVGIPLDGTNATALIPDSDGGSLDGDPVYDRAVGPMQFIPSTWRAYARDGDGDGRSDPNNIYDAAAGAARYLCASGPMQTDEQMTRGFLSYNHSNAYAASVLRWAHVYAALALPVPSP
jgi:membrane-bound lytic murein transglycosylase B